MTEDSQTTAATVVDDPTPHQNNSIQKESLKVSGESTPAVLREVSSETFEKNNCLGVRIKLKAVKSGRQNGRGKSDVEMV